MNYIETLTFWTAFAFIAGLGFFLIFFNFKAYQRKKQRGIEIRKFLNTNQNTFRHESHRR